MLKNMKILSVGNSFAHDTLVHLPNIMRSLGVEEMKIAFLYIGGCSINRHWENAQNDAPAYKYYTNDGSGWINSEDYNTKISDAIKSEQWDIISIQHGTGDGSRYTSPESYANLPALVSYVKSLAPETARIVFNMAWVGSPDKQHHEILSYNGNTGLMYENLLKTTQTVVGNTEGIDMVTLTGAAIEAARDTELSDLLLRDGFHLSYGIGRYIAALAFLKAITGTNIDNVTWAPADVDDNARALAITCANNPKTFTFHQQYGMIK